MAKKNNALKTITFKEHLTSDTFNRSEIVKAPNGMLFKLYGDSHNCSNTWEISVWSNVFNQWNWIADMQTIPNVFNVSYYNCTINNKPNPQISINWRAMKEFIETFVSNLPS